MHVLAGLDYSSYLNHVTVSVHLPFCHLHVYLFFHSHLRRTVVFTEVLLTMASRETLVFKSTDNLDLKLDIYTRESWSQIKVWDERQPVVVFFHGGGYVGYDREHLPPHIVQSCLLRGWPLISPDYRKLPQVTGEDILSDAEAAYDYVVENALRILTRGESNQAMKNIIVVGASAGQCPVDI